MASSESEGRCFTFLWQLENADFCPQKKGEGIGSPGFVVDAIDQARWKLWLYPRGKTKGNLIGFYLNNEAGSKSADKIEIKYELAFIAKDGSVLISSGICKRAFPKGVGFGFDVLREDVFIFRRLVFLQDDTLRARCRIWKSVGEMAEDVQCIAHTRIGIEKRNFICNVKNYSTLKSEKKFAYQIKSTQNDVLLVSVDISLNGEISFEEVIHYKLSFHDQSIKFCTLRLFLTDNLGYRVECNKEEIWFDSPVQRHEFRFSLTKQKLLENKSMYMQKDTFSLLWMWAFFKGVVSEEIEEDKYGYICPEVKIFDAQNDKYEKTNLLNILVDNMKSLYDEHFLSDIKLKTNTSVFPAHKFILCTSSSVFKAMFSNEKERISNYVNIEDLSDDTISRMLLFIYTTRVEDLTWESASRLYVAADKYAIIGLKNICSSYLKDNLSPSNACETLLLSDFHGVSDLKSAVQDYILKHGKQIMNSEEWKALMQTNAKVAAETLCLLFK
ncbi:Protein roadkill [Araneus ventricosus]|uniref:Protein roadkill n=1 Tax=Araneus ventricosus TaxID=182803 RepID=A0A4Y2D7A3_ARAVE|nr:Protein roadkill [Araneus ventricosus]